MMATQPLGRWGALLEMREKISPLDLPSGFGFLKEQVLAHKVVVLRGCQSLTTEEFLRFCTGFDRDGSKLLQWEFGPVLELKVSAQPANYLFSSEKVLFHWDGFFLREPSFLVWQCVQAPRRGGQTLFADTSVIWELADEAQRRIWERAVITYTTEKKAHYGGQVSIPMTRRHPTTHCPTLRYAEPLTTGDNPLSVQVNGWSSEEQEHLIQDMRDRLYDDRVCYAHTWRDGDILIADNHVLLHGRTAFAAGDPRHLRRIQIL